MGSAPTSASTLFPNSDLNLKKLRERRIIPTRTSTEKYAHQHPTPSFPLTRPHAHFSTVLIPAVKPVKIYQSDLERAGRTSIAPVPRAPVVSAREARLARTSRDAVAAQIRGTAETAPLPSRRAPAARPRTAEAERKTRRSRTRPVAANRCVMHRRALSFSSLERRSVQAREDADIQHWPTFQRNGLCWPWACWRSSVASPRRKPELG
ncbi:hypothetical protein DFH07DRAFT_790645 [Mycena maculata]|uniref:Uncharacterized protein n=1 Tax=Mycena maculata TaxID=230809 RepID=A0AAD7P091_9AGAR|nr:hypothetical protein DFH07DRAFT_790645 [Mycena maculata]